MKHENRDAGNHYDGDTGPHGEADGQIDDLEAFGEKEVTYPIEKEAEYTWDQSGESLCIVYGKIAELFEYDTEDKIDICSFLCHCFCFHGNRSP